MARARVVKSVRGAILFEVRCLSEKLKLEV